MSGKKPSFPSATMPAAEAEEFMALLLAAQKSTHNCAWKRYFDKIGKRMIKQHMPEGIKEGEQLSKKVKEEYDVTVLSRREIVVFPKVGEELKQLMITYIAAGLPPATITIDKEKWTIEGEKRYIKEEIKRRLQEKPEKYRV